MASRRPASRKILVVDDSEIACDFVRSVLEEAGYGVLTLNSHFGFVKLLREEKPELILIDVTMPVLSGPKLVELARTKRVLECPIVLYSDRDEDDLTELAAQCGADGYIKKSSDPADLLSAVARAMLVRGRGRGAR
jgi:DNA-binding response OmpR family regulator